MSGKILVSTAYLPTIEYFSHLSQGEKAVIEREENYLKQSYRNRCYILSAHGPQLLSVPVYLGSQHKISIKDIRIDCSKRWQQVHLRAIIAAYNSSPYFQFYFENIERIITRKNEFLFDMNTELTETILKMLKLKVEVGFTDHFEAPGEPENDFRYTLSPKKETAFTGKKYLQVFNSGDGFVPGLSIIDLIFNTGPEAITYF